MRMRLRTNAADRLKACGDLVIQTYDDNRNVNDVLKERAYLDLTSIYRRNAPLYLEIGCGQGGFICKTAVMHPENDYLAVEKIGNVLLTGAENAFNENIGNLRFMRAKAECLTKYIPPHSVSGVYLNFSTPLPRQGYAKQRLTAPRFLDIYRELLVPGGFVSQKTDDRAFFEFSAEQFENNGFIITEKTDNLHKDGEKGVVTEYERKFIALNKPIYALKAIIKE
ncbi:MAG: tRNA (guanosine(46)-N7)-methyltransferase TrmB [Christensenellales bacterium]